MVGTRVYNFNGYTFAARPFSTKPGTSTYFYSPIIPASGRMCRDARSTPAASRRASRGCCFPATTRTATAALSPTRIASRFATSDRSLIPDDVILPMFDDAADRRPIRSSRSSRRTPSTRCRTSPGTGRAASCRCRSSRARTAAWSISAPHPSSRSPATGRRRRRRRSRLEAAGVRPLHRHGDGLDCRTSTGRRYEGGGTYRFWIAKRMTLATATFQGMPYPVGSSYGRDIQFNPAVPADVQVTATLYRQFRPDERAVATYPERRRRRASSARRRG